MTAYAHTLPPPKTRDEWEPLEDHLAAVGEYAARHCEPFASREWGRLAGLWHDVGKYRPEFQARLRGERVEAEHAGVGAVPGRLLAQTGSGGCAFRKRSSVQNGLLSRYAQAKTKRAEARSCQVAEIPMAVSIHTRSRAGDNNRRFYLSEARSSEQQLRHFSDEQDSLLGGLYETKWNQPPIAGEVKQAIKDEVGCYRGSVITDNDVGKGMGGWWVKKDCFQRHSEIGAGG